MLLSWQCCNWHDVCLNVVSLPRPVVLSMFTSCNVIPIFYVGLNSCAFVLPWPTFFILKVSIVCLFEFKCFTASRRTVLTWRVITVSLRLGLTPFRSQMPLVFWCLLIEWLHSFQKVWQSNVCVVASCTASFSVGICFALAALMFVLHDYACPGISPLTKPLDLQAEKIMIEKNENKEYLPIEGLDTFRKATVDLLLGSSSAAVKEVCLLKLHTSCLCNTMGISYTDRNTLLCGCTRWTTPRVECSFISSR